MGTDDTSGFIDDRDDSASITLSDGGTTLVRRIRRGTRWYVAKSPGHSVDPAFACELLRKEYELLSRLSHRNIVRVAGFEELPEYGPTVITDWIDGQPLDRFLASGNVSRVDRRRLSRQLIDAVAYIHDNNITHRDLKPSNLLVDNLGNLVVIDFGLADDPASCIFKRVTGTAGFTAPELENGAAEIDWRRADVYALGMMLRAIDAGYPYRILGRRCMKTEASARPADGSAAKAAMGALRFRMTAALSAVIALIVGLAVYSLVPVREENYGFPRMLYSVPLKVSRDSVASDTDTIGPEVELPAPADVMTEKMSGQYENVRATTVTPDVNFALLKGCDIRDRLRYVARTAGKSDYDRTELDRQTDRLLDIGHKSGWTEEEYAFARSALKSLEFYNGKTPVYYIGHTYSAVDTLSTDTP